MSFGSNAIKSKFRKYAHKLLAIHSLQKQLTQKHSQECMLGYIPTSSWMDTAPSYQGMDNIMLSHCLLVSELQDKNLIWSTVLLNEAHNNIIRMTYACSEFQSHHIFIHNKSCPFSFPIIGPMVEDVCQQQVIYIPIEWLIQILVIMKYFRIHQK